MLKIILLNFWHRKSFLKQEFKKKKMIKRLFMLLSGVENLIFRSV